MKILALDLSKRRSGWAAWGIGSPNAIYGSWVLGSEYSKTGQVYARLHECMADLHKVHGFDFIYFEEPINPVQLQGDTNIDAIKILSGLAAHAESFGYAMGCRGVYEVNIATWRADFLGKKKISGARKRAKEFNRPARDLIKRLTIDECKALGFDPKFDDEADALGILDFACSLHDLTPPWRLADPTVPAAGAA